MLFGRRRQTMTVFTHNDCRRSASAPTLAPAAAVARQLPDTRRQIIEPQTLQSTERCFAGRTFITSLLSSTVSHFSLICGTWTSARVGCEPATCSVQLLLLLLLGDYRGCRAPLICGTKPVTTVICDSWRALRNAQPDANGRLSQSALLFLAGARRNRKCQNSTHRHRQTKYNSQ